MAKEQQCPTLTKQKKKNKTLPKAGTDTRTFYLFF